MNEFFPQRNAPLWINKISQILESNELNIDEIKTKMKFQMGQTSILDILNESLFYSACGNDIHPIDFFNKHIYSFVYSLDTIFNLGYESEFPSIKVQLKNENYRKRCNIDLLYDDLINFNWTKSDSWLTDNKHSLKANWSIWEKDKLYFSLIFIYCKSETLWRNIYKNNSCEPYIFVFQGMFDGWKGGLGPDEGDDFVVNPQIYSDGINVYKNNKYKKRE